MLTDFVQVSRSIIDIDLQLDPGPNNTLHGIWQLRLDSRNVCINQTIVSIALIAPSAIVWIQTCTMLNSTRPRLNNYLNNAIIDRLKRSLKFFYLGVYPH